MKPFFNKDLLSLMEDTECKEIEKISVIELPLDQVFPGKAQPRRNFSEEEVANLAASMKSNGIINPISVLKVGENNYEIIAGERRWRAAKHLEWATIPSIIRNISLIEARAVALIENLQRENLDPVEEAEGYAKLIEDFAFTHAELGTYVGRPRSSISNSLRLLDLSSGVKNMLSSGELEIGHAKLLIPLSKDIQMLLAKKCVKNAMSVRQLEQVVKSHLSPNKNNERVVSVVKANELAKLSRHISNLLQVEVEVVESSKSKVCLTTKEIIAMLEAIE